MRSAVRSPASIGLKRKLPRRIIVARIVFVVLLTMISAELAMRIGYAIYRPDVSVRRLIEEEYDLTQHVMVGRRSTQPNVLHPYVGFVVDPTRNQKFNSYGFWQVDGPILKRSSDSIIVGITGGSVARDLCEYSAETLRQELTRRFPEKKISIVCLAQEGFREPQLAMTVSYFQTLGAEFDIVVSLSGFNEAVLHPAESRTDDLWIGYPRDWDVRLTDTEDPEMNRLIWEGQTVQVQRTEWAVRAYKLRHIPLLSIHGVWSAIDAQYKTRLIQAAANLLDTRREMMARYANVGPRTKYPSAEARKIAQCDMWCAGARQLHRLCEHGGGRFVLCLQPNLHDNHQKTLTDEEESIKVRGSIYQEWIVKNYEYFAAAAANLRDEGLAFYDLRNIYDEVSSTVYRDECCHFNQEGNHLLALQIAGLISAELEREEPVP